MSARASLPLIGRERERERALGILGKGANLLVTGRAGIGKSALLRALHQQLAGARVTFWLGSGTPKAVLYELAQQIHHTVGLRVPETLIPLRFRAQAAAGGVHWRWINRAFSRLPVPEAIALLADSLRGRGALLFVDSLELPPSQAELFAQLVDVAQVAAALDDANRRVRIVRLLWRFPERIELRPLPAQAARQLAEAWLAQRPVCFASERVRAGFLRAIAQDAAGLPTAIVGMCERAAHEPEVTRTTMRALTHEAGVRYLDMTPLLTLTAAGFIAARYVARGIGSNELYILAGVATALFLVLRFVVARTR